MEKPKTLEQLRAEKERAETRLAQEQHKLNRLENRKKFLEQGERKKRTHRLCNLGGTVEIELVKRHTEFTEFSASLLNEFIEKVIVHEAVKTEGKRTMQVDIYLNFIGKFELPLTEQEQQESEPKRTSKKKLRRDMTEEQRTRERERDHKRYAQKVAAKKAAEEAARMAILQGTAYEVQKPKPTERKSA